MTSLNLLSGLIMDLTIEPRTRPTLCEQCGWWFYSLAHGCSFCQGVKRQDAPQRNFDIQKTLLTPPALPRPNDSRRVCDAKVYGAGSLSQSTRIPDKPEGYLRFVCISDTHSLHRSLLNVPHGDVLVHTGDITRTGSAAVLSDFDEWMGTLPHTHKLVLPGNHDITLLKPWYDEHWMRFHQDYEPWSQPFRNFKMLINEAVNIEGALIYGTPWVVDYHDWAFGLSDELLRTSAELIPDSVDVLLTHGPPKGQRDKTRKSESAGDPHLAKAVEKSRPFVHVFGHIHDSYGVSSVQLKATHRRGSYLTNFINCALMGSSKLKNRPIVFDLAFAK